MKKRLMKLTGLFCALAVLLSVCGCSLSAYSVEELRVLYPQAIENSLREELYYWKETDNRSVPNTYRTCNVYAELDQKYEPLREENGAFSNMKVDILEQEGGKKVYTAQCGRSDSKNGGAPKNYLFESFSYNEEDKPQNRKKTEMTPQEYMAGEAFQRQYSLNTMLKELQYLTVDDMDFDFENAVLEHQGNVVKIDFRIRDSYLERYRAEFGTESVFAGSNHVAMEFSYDRFSSLIVYMEEQLGLFTADKEVHKLEVVYFGPIVNLPNYDHDDWKNA